MRLLNILFPIDLQLFGEGGAGAAAAGGEGGTGGEGATGVTPAAAGQGKKGANPLADVVYGKQPKEAPAAGEQTETANQTGTDVVTEDLGAEFEKLIKGKYKAQFDQRMQDTVQKRLKGSKETVDKYNALAPALQMLSQRYGVDPADVAALSQAIQDDDAYYEAEAMEKGMSVEHLKQVKKMERENAQLRQQLHERESRENADRLYASWMADSEKIKGIYPQFELNAEMQNPQFVSLLRSNIPMQTAYEVIHKDEIIPAAMQFAAQKTEANMAAKVAANRARPTENGMRSRSAAVHKSDVSQLTKADRQDFIRRAARGEKISF